MTPEEFDALPLGTLLKHENTEKNTLYRKVEGGTGWMTCKLDGKSADGGDVARAHLRRSDPKLSVMSPKVNPKVKKSFRIAELEAQVAELEDTNTNLLHDVRNCSQRCAATAAKADDLQYKLDREIAVSRRLAIRLENAIRRTDTAVAAERELDGADSVKLYEIAKAFMDLHNLAKDVVGPKPKTAAGAMAGGELPTREEWDAFTPRQRGERITRMQAIEAMEADEEN